MRTKRLHRLVLAALFAALTCVATAAVQIELPATRGYVNMGDSLVLVGAWLLGPLYGAAAAGIGSALADILTSYVHYAPATLLIKAGMAVLAICLCRKSSRRPTLRRISGAILAELWMVAGYFGYACLILGKGLAAAASIPGNLLQGAFGIAVALPLFFALKKAGIPPYDKGEAIHGGA